jgi:hypothetical protein
MRERIDRLEEMVKRLISSNQSDPSTATPSSGDTSALRGVDYRSSTRVGRTFLDGEHSVYKPADDWQDVLREVRYPMPFACHTN